MEEIATSDHGPKGSGESLALPIFRLRQTACWGAQFGNGCQEMRQQ